MPARRSPWTRPRVVNDSLFGTTVAVDAKGTPTTRAVAMPLADIRTAEVQKADGTSTLMLVVGIVGAMVLVGVSMSNFMDDTISLDGMSLSD